MSKKPKPLTDQLREAVSSADVTVYRIAQETGIDKSALSKFLNGQRGLSMTAMDAIGNYLGLRIVSDKKGK